MQEIEDEKNYEERAETAAGAIAPIAAVGPRREGANEEEDQDDEENEHTDESELRAAADAIGGASGFWTAGKQTAVIKKVQY